MTSSARPTHLVLVGMMGVGKSTVGKRLASRLHRPFVDSDDEVVARTGRDVAEIFTTEGEPAFRELEAAVMDEVLSSPVPSVVAAAGGSILNDRTRAKLKDSGTVVWMRAPVDVLVTRTSRGSHRPALADDPVGTLRRLDSDRAALYAEVADVTVDCTQPLTAVVQSIIDALEEVPVR